MKHEHISNRELQLPDAVIGKLIKIAVEDKSIISLGPGEPDFPAPDYIVEHTKKIADKVNHYSPPGGIVELREAAAKKLKKENKIDCSPDNIVVTAGSQEALLLATACTLDPSEQIVLPNPGFMSYLPGVELFNVNPTFVELKEEDGYEINPDLIKKQIIPKKTRVLLLNSPSNPTGTVIRKKVLEEIADIAIENDMYVFSDEAYEKIIYDDAKHVSIGSLNGMQDHVATFQSFSKTFAMCGYRVGYVSCDEKLAQAMTKTHMYSSISASTMSQHLGVKALQKGYAYANLMVKEYDRRRKMLVKRLNEMGLSTPMPKGAFYTFSNISHLSKNSFKFANELLTKGKVATIPGSEFGSFGEGHIRCSYATDYKLIEKALDRMEKFIRSYKP